jgi:hypothetical protein
MVKIKMEIFYLPVRSTTLEFLYSVKVPSFQSAWEIGRISHTMTLVSSDYEDVKKRIGLAKYAELLGVSVDSITDAEVELVTMKMERDNG